MANRIMYEVEIKHDGLNKYRHIKGSDPYVVKQKASMQKKIWDEMWAKKVKKEKQIKETNDIITDIENQNLKIQKEILELENILKNGIEDILHFKIDNFKSKKSFSDKKPKKPTQNDPGIRNQLNFPEKSAKKYNPKFGIMGWIFPFIKNKKIKENELLYEQDLKEFEQKEKESKIRYLLAFSKFEKELDLYISNESKYYEEQNIQNNRINHIKENYKNGNPDAILEYIEMVLTYSKYPEIFPKEFDLEFKEESGHLIIDYSVPSPDEFPKIKEIRFVKTRNEVKEIPFTTRENNALYDDVLYQVALRSMHEIFVSDKIDKISLISFNGFVTSLDRATGNYSTKCLLSVQSTKEKFLEISLENVDPRTCFKSLKGVASSKLHTTTPIAPIIAINKDDHRFVDAYSVTDEIDDSVNIAAMDWEDFEHLIRELFEQEFQQVGGDVKVTQASRDGGVDAVAFDPDPIRGGKIVIQAKRYTNTVGVAAVRDLYGTLVNEGATKGILVTTSDYGADSYEFAKDKPITLLNGSNLLHLLEKHGHKAKINIQEAKKIISSQDEIE